MDWTYLSEIIFKAIGSCGAAIIVGFATALFTKLSTKIKDSRIAAFINQTVKAAEQLYPNEGQKMGAQKYEYVLNQVLIKFPKLVKNDYLKALIEGAVYTISQQTKDIAQEVVKLQETISKPNDSNLIIF